MNFINKLNRKFGKYAIPNLMYYIIIMYITGIIISFINPNFYGQYLSLDINKILHGQVWRLVTFIIYLPGEFSLWTVFELYLYYMIGVSLERAWGTFRFNLYYLSGMLLNIIAAFIVYFAFHAKIGNIGMFYINRSLFLAFAAMFPNIQFLIFFIIPVKVKYLGILYGGVIVYSIINALMNGDILSAIVILISVGNFLIFFFATRNVKRFTPSEIRRKHTFKKQVREGRRGETITQFPGKKTITRHKCAICGRTELDDEDLEFRFCSKCDGEYEYCMDHLFTHEHVHK